MVEAPSAYFSRTSYTHKTRLQYALCHVIPAREHLGPVKAECENRPAFIDKPLCFKLSKRIERIAEKNRTLTPAEKGKSAVRIHYVAGLLARYFLFRIRLACFDASFS